MAEISSADNNARSRDETHEEESLREKEEVGAAADKGLGIKAILKIWASQDSISTPVLSDFCPALDKKIENLARADYINFEAAKF